MVVDTVVGVAVVNVAVVGFVFVDDDIDGVELDMVVVAAVVGGVCCWWRLLLVEVLAVEALFCSRVNVGPCLRNRF